MAWGNCFEGDLVRIIGSPGTKLPDPYHGTIGIITERWPRWPNDDRDDEMLVKILVVDIGKEEVWSEWDVEVISESQ